MTAIILNLDAISTLTHQQFWELCLNNRDIQLELTAQGELIVMPPTGWESGKRNFDISGQLWNWNRIQSLGTAFDSSTGFKLPNGAVRSPDVAWVTLERLNKLDPDPDGFLPLAPDFAIELRSASDRKASPKENRLKPLQEKMREYRDNGVRLGWLLNIKDGEVEIYRPDCDVEVLKLPSSLSGEAVLPGFVLDLKGIF